MLTEYFMEVLALILPCSCSLPSLPGCKVEHELIVHTTHLDMGVGTMICNF
jgi:hypothetical protein